MRAEFQYRFNNIHGVPVAQWIKRGTTDQAVRVPSPPEAESTQP